MTRMSAREELRLDSPKVMRSRRPPVLSGGEGDSFGRFTESIARIMGTPGFLAVLTAFCVLWMSYNILPGVWHFDQIAHGFIALTLVLSLQASYAAPLIILAQNRQDDRDRAQVENDRIRAERNLAETEYLAREVVALRLESREKATTDFVRAELKAFWAEVGRRQ